MRTLEPSFDDRQSNNRKPNATEAIAQLSLQSKGVSRLAKKEVDRLIETARTDRFLRGSGRTGPLRSERRCSIPLVASPL
jgi:hypothetical protein